jgi:hypothetical protein
MVPQGIGRTLTQLAIEVPFQRLDLGSLAPLIGLKDLAVGFHTKVHGASSLRDMVSLTQLEIRAGEDDMEAVCSLTNLRQLRLFGHIQELPSSISSLKQPPTWTCTQSDSCQQNWVCGCRA